MKKIIWLVLIGIIVILQLIPNGRPESTDFNPNDLIVNNTLPDSVSVIFKTSCYDCHSNQSIYPWYSYVAPVSWLVARDVRNGRKELNFSDWESLDKMDKAKLLDNIIDEVSDGSMPLQIYPIMHPEAKLKKSDRQMIVDWAESYGESLFN